MKQEAQAKESARIPLQTLGCGVAALQAEYIDRHLSELGAEAKI